VYSSRIWQTSSVCKLSVLHDLCLDCIASILDRRYGTVPEIGDVFFTAELRHKWRRYYRDFYREDEQAEMEQWESEEEMFRAFDYSMQRILPWLSKRGARRTCPHLAGACRDIDCCRGTAVEPTSEEEVDPAEMEERKPSAARLIVGKRKTKEGKQGKGAAKWAAV
jgi:hypothetical protein